jgi:hypothetical protein
MVMVATNKKIQKGKITKTKGDVLKIDMETKTIQTIKRKTRACPI